MVVIEQHDADGFLGEVLAVGVLDHLGSLFFLGGGSAALFNH